MTMNVKCIVLAIMGIIFTESAAALNKEVHISLERSVCFPVCEGSDIFTAPVATTETLDISLENSVCCPGCIVVSFLNKRPRFASSDMLSDKTTKLFDFAKEKQLGCQLYDWDTEQTLAKGGWMLSQRMNYLLKEELETSKGLSLDGNVVKSLIISMKNNEQLLKRS
ncbi:hypothetical protein FACS189449_00660 [Alphaproteobacteria bacterium]|nr:hypothetical protein FACS189449_00660 [Alphaproteobacteria bacterium]